MTKTEGHRKEPRRGVESDRLDRVLPSAIDAEQSVLGAILLAADQGDRFDKLMATLADNLAAEDFYHEPNRLIFAAMMDLWNEKTPVDAVTLCTRLSLEGHLEGSGGAAYIAQLAAVVPTAAHALSYAGIVREKATLRAIATYATDLARRAYAAAEPSAKLVEQADGALIQLEQRTRLEKAPSLNEAISDALDGILSPDRQCVSTGFRSIDNLLQGGMKRGHMIILAARTSKGKSALAFNIATRIPRGGTLVITLEMPASELLQRALVEMSMIDVGAIRQGRQLYESESERLQWAADELQRRNLEVIFEPKITARQIRARARAAANRWDGKLDLVVVDYLQRMRAEHPNDKRHLEIAEITDAVKTIAGELDAPILMLAQLNRETNRNENPMPRLEHLRESGAIEQDADEVMFLWESPNPNQNWADARTVHLNLAKHRNGPIGSVDLKFEPRFTKFTDLKD